MAIVGPAEIVTWPNEILGRPAKPVPQDERCREIIDLMFASLGANGIGLAAPQIGIDKSIIVVKVPAQGRNAQGYTQHAIINPELFWWKGGPVLDYEGCLSFPGERVLVPRFDRVKVRGFDVRWNPIVIGGKGLVARVLQHEIDHLRGRTLAHYKEMAERIEEERKGAESAEAPQETD